MAYEFPSSEKPLLRTPMLSYNAIFFSFCLLLSSLAFLPLEYVSAHLLSCGSSHTCYIDSAGALNCHGENTVYGQAPLKAIAQPYFEQVSSGMFHTCAVVKGGMLRCWGKNDHEEAPFQKTRPDHPQSLYSRVSVGAGGHTCALVKCSPDNLNCDTEGDIECWGSNFAGAAPGTITGKFESVSAGTYHTCGITKEDDKNDNKIKCWGSNWFGQAPPLLEDGNYSQISSGFHHSCALYSNGSVTCFGENNENQCDTDSVAGMSFVEVTASGYHSCALKSDLENVVCWGDNSFGQAPLANSTNGYTSVAAPSEHKFKSISGGATHTCAYMVDSNCPDDPPDDPTDDPPYLNCVVDKKCWGWNVSE